MVMTVSEKVSLARDGKWLELERKTAVEDAAKWMDGVAESFERAANEARSYRKRFDEAIAEADAGKEAFTKPEDVIGWLVNSVNFPANNMRLDMAGKHAVAVHEAYRKVRAAAEAVRDAEVVNKSNTARYMLAALPTLAAGKRGAAEYAKRLRGPDVIHLGDFDACYARAVDIAGSRVTGTPEMVRNSGGSLAVAVTDSWTYYVKPLVASDDAKI